MRLTGVHQGAHQEDRRQDPAGPFWNIAGRIRSGSREGLRPWQNNSLQILDKIVAAGRLILVNTAL